MGFKILEEIGIALGNKKVNSDYFINQVEDHKKASLEHYYTDIVGKDIRYLVDDSQTSLSLACEAAKKALEDNHLSGKDIDMVICTSYTPEYAAPVMARYVVDAIDGREDVICFDMNVNCTAMLVAIDMADRYFKTDENINHILIVQGECTSSLKIKKESPFFGIFSDVGCAIVLERSEESGIISRDFMLKRSTTNSIVYPENGFSKPDYNFYTVPGLDPRVDVGTQKVIEKLGWETINQIKFFGISQFAKVSHGQFLDYMHVSEEKVPYVGDQFGYTSGSSPIFALREGIKEGKVKRGDHIVLWTYGAGVQYAMLEMIF